MDSCGDGVGGCAVAAWDEVRGAAVADERWKVGRSGRWGEHGRLRSELELGGRWDGGRVEKGYGVEVGGGVKYADARMGLEVEVEGRYLLGHRSEEFRERGASVAVRFDPGGGRGGGCGWGWCRAGVRSGSGVESLWGSVLDGGGESASGRLGCGGGISHRGAVRAGGDGGGGEGGGRDALVRRQVPGPDKLVAPGWWPVVTFFPARCRFERGEWRPGEQYAAGRPRNAGAVADGSGPVAGERIDPSWWSAGASPAGQAPRNAAPSPARSRPGNRGRAPRPGAARRASPARCHGRRR